MPAKVKKRLKNLAVTEMAKPKFFRMVDKIIPDMIVNTIKKGISPVNQRKTDNPNTSGKSRFSKYSDSYKSAMGTGKLKTKRQRPVNLTLTGKMLRSIKHKKRKNSVFIEFTDEKAFYHNEVGAGKSRVIRRILPKDGEEFSRLIQRKIVDLLGKAITLVTK